MKVRISKIGEVDRQLAGLPKGLSFFDPICGMRPRRPWRPGDEVFLSRDPEEARTAFSSTTGTRRRALSSQGPGMSSTDSTGLKPSSYIFSELEWPEPQKEMWNIWQLEVDRAPGGAQVQVPRQRRDRGHGDREFMAATQPETNRRWVRVALGNGDRCFVVKIC